VVRWDIVRRHVGTSKHVFVVVKEDTGRGSVQNATGLYSKVVTACSRQQWTRRGGRAKKQHGKTNQMILTFENLCGPSQRCSGNGNQLPSGRTNRSRRYLCGPSWYQTQQHRPTFSVRCVYERAMRHRTVTQYHVQRAKRLITRLKVVRATNVRPELAQRVEGHVGLRGVRLQTHLLLLKHPNRCRGNESRQSGRSV
jgi:hypothetical protein